MSSAMSVVPTHAEVTRDSLVQVALQVVIATQADAEDAASLLVGLIDLEKSIKAAHDPVVNAAKEAHNAAIAARTEALRPVTDATSHLRGAMASYQKKVEDEYRREVERKQREAEAEAERIRAAARAEAERKQAEEMERRRVEAEALRKLHAEKAAEAIEAEPVPEVIPDPVHVVPLPTYVPPPPKMDGVQFRTTRKPEITSLRELCASIGRGDVPDYLVKADMAQIGNWIKANRKDLPGVRMVEVKRTVVKR
ncbi:MAG: hypothetical protein KJ050_10540 [Candidatus Omnitrophica bacterium]|nr:hypothetical protein [Candidatus Omnitrophota bacterium]